MISMRDVKTSKDFLINKYGYASYQSLIEIGDWVMVKDGSYMVGLGHECFELDKPSDVPYFTPGLRNDIFQVVAVNVDCPTNRKNQDSGSLSHQNNCIIKSLVNKDIFFCSLINLKKLYKEKIDTSDLSEENVSTVMLRDMKINSII